jgi:Protein of unknown function (DUF3616)
MNPTPSIRRIPLHFADHDRAVTHELSAVVTTENNLWTGSDESIGIDRLTRQADGSYGEHVSFNLNDYFHLPSGSSEEVDLEGLDFDGDALWAVGSHSLKRRKPRGDTLKDQLRAFRIRQFEANRSLLARLPLIRRSESDYFPDPTGISQLDIESGENVLIAALKKDDYLAPYLAIPGKENGFDIEGIAVRNDRIFLGLRGPVLRGYAVILELALKEISKGEIRLKKIGEGKALYRRHFLSLAGLGCRDFAIWENDLLILAGPALDHDGPTMVFRWRDAFTQTEKVSLLDYEKDSQLTKEFTLPTSPLHEDKAEGMTLLNDREMLVVYDAPQDDRHPQPGMIEGDVIAANWEENDRQGSTTIGNDRQVEEGDR